MNSIAATPYRTPARRPRGGFTLIELLVVISIITLLISILLPQLSAARRIAQRVYCNNNIRSLLQGMSNYATANDDAIIGSPNTSGVYLAGVNVGIWPGPCTTRWDFMGPMARDSGMEEPMTEDPATRFNLIRNMKHFQCPSNPFLSGPFAGSQINAGYGPMVSYNSSRNFLFLGTGRKGTVLKPAENGNPAVVAGTEGIDVIPNSHEEQLPWDYGPRLARVGDAANKIAYGDGSRYATVTIQPDYDLSVQATYGGTHSDAGSYSSYSRSWDRGGAPGNQWASIACSGGNADARQYSFRHSQTATPPCAAAANAYLGNFGFFDGHADTLGDLKSASPFMWLPAGSTVTKRRTAQYEDVLREYFGSVGEGRPLRIGT